MKIGVITDCLKLPLKEAIIAAAQNGFEGVQIYANSDDFSPETLTAEKKLEIKALLKENNLVISALCGDLGGHGFERAEEVGDRIEKTKRIIDLAVEFDTKVITTHIGVIPADENDPTFAVMLAALTECGKYAAGKGISLAIETGPEIAPTLYNFVSKTEGGVGVNLDPANFVMVTGQDPAEAVYLLKDYIVHTHLKDGKMLKRSNPKEIYDCFAEGGIESLNVADYFEETPIGKGNVDFVKYLSALQEIGFDGFLTVEREAGDNPIEDILEGVGYIKGLQIV